MVSKGERRLDFANIAQSTHLLWKRSLSSILDSSVRHFA